MTLTLLNNRYQVLRVLGSGGFGETFLAEDTQMPSSRRCVIKQLIPVANNPQVYQLVQQRFQQEATILEELGDLSNQIPRLYAYFSEGGQFYLVQEYIEGQTLTQRMQQQGLLNESLVKDILINILLILEFVHSKGIVHRDIKPDNIILRFSDGKPVLIDFGAVKVTMGTIMSASGNSNQSIVIGTPGFMPMEQSVGRPVFSSDLYSLGLTIIYLLTGKLPQDLPTDPARGDILWRHYAPNISPNFADVLDKSIQQSPRDRYLNARDMLTALQTPPTPIAPTLPSPQATVIAAPATVNYAQPATIAAPPPSQHPYQPQTSTQYPIAPTNGLGTWQQAVIIGGVIGVFLVGGLWVIGIVNKPKESVTTNNTSSTSTVQQQPINATPEATTNLVTPPVQEKIVISQPDAQPVQPLTTNATISQNAAVDLLKTWIAAKREIFAPPYRKDLGERLLTGKAYGDNIQKPDTNACIASGKAPDDCISSVDWLRTNNAYYSYGVQSLDRVNRFTASGDQATIEVVITEERTLYKNGRIDRQQTSFETITVRYSLLYENGQVKIADYKTVR
jgi:serine/threonine-protein kinase